MIVFVIVLFLTEIHQTVFIFDEVLFISCSLNIVCMTPASLFLIHTPASNRASLFYSSSPLTKRVCCRDVLPVVLSPSAAGHRGCVGCTDLRGIWMPSTPLRLDPVSCGNKNDFLPLNSALTLIRADSKCLIFFLCPSNTC